METEGAPAGSDDGGRRRLDRVDAVRRAVDQAVAATAGSTRTRVHELTDELTQIAGRVRGALEDLGSAGTTQAGALADDLQQAVGRLGRVLDDPRASGEDPALRARVEDLEQRLAALEARVDARPDGGAPAVRGA